jgi:hypothetical protein
MWLSRLDRYAFSGFLDPVLVIGAARAAYLRAL